MKNNGLNGFQRQNLSDDYVDKGCVNLFIGIFITITDINHVKFILSVCVSEYG